MNKIVTNIKNLELETIENLRSSKAKNTLRAYKADYKDFDIFCSKNNFQSMPADPKILSLYLTHLSKNSKFSTLKRRLASISSIHRIKGHYIDIKHPIIIENLLGIKRNKGIKQTSKKPLLINEIKLIIDVINNSNIKLLRRIRDKALILLGFSGGFRRSELVNLEYEDLDFVSEGVKIFIRRSKTDQSGEGMTKALPYFPTATYCPVENLKTWLTLDDCYIVTQRYVYIYISIYL